MAFKIIGGVTRDGAVAQFQWTMMMEVGEAAKAMKDAEIEAEIEDFLEGFKQPTYRACGSMGSRWLPGHPSMGGLGTAGRALSGFIRNASSPRKRA